MATKKKMLQAAAGSGGGGVTPTIFVTDNESTIIAVDVSDPTAMTELSLFATGFSGTGGSFLGADSTKSLLFMSWGDNSHVIDASNPEVLSTLGSVDLGDGAEAEIAVDADLEVFFVGCGDGLFAVDYSAPATPTQLDLYSTVGTANVAVVDPVAQVAYVTSTSRDELISLDYSTPTNITLLDTETNGATLDGARYMALSPDGDTIFVAAQSDDEISSFNVSSPAIITYINDFTSGTFMNNPRHVFYNTSTSELIGLTTQPNLGISIVDVSNPSSMSLNGSLIVADMGSLAGAVFNDAEQVLFVSFRDSATTYTNQVVAFDVSNSASIAVLGTFTPSAVTNLGSMALIA